MGNSCLVAFRVRKLCLFFQLLIVDENQQSGHQKVKLPHQLTPPLPEQPREHELIAQVTSTDIDYPIYMAKAGSMHGVHVIRETMRYLYK